VCSDGNHPARVDWNAFERADAVDHAVSISTAGTFISPNTTTKMSRRDGVHARDEMATNNAISIFGGFLFKLITSSNAGKKPKTIGKN
jgi:hypothetical protein